MKPGPKPKPALTLVGGRTAGKRRPRRRPKPRPSAPRAPAWLSAQARIEWRRVVPELDRLGLIGRLDGGILAVYCETLATFVAAQRDVLAASPVRKGRNRSDGKVKNPAVQVARDAAQLLLRFAAEFGLTPSARARLEVPGSDDAQDDDLFD